MKTLIYSIDLILMYYMNSNNITMHKFGIENNYISMAMNSMLGKTNNTAKSMNISETNAMVIDSELWCIISIIAFIFAMSIVIASAAFVTVGTDGIGAPAMIWLVGYFGTTIFGILSVGHACNW